MKQLPEIKTTFYLLFVIFNTSLFSQNFTWKKGPNVTDISGVYGTQGVAAPTNTPGTRDHAASWTDAAGNFWLFGGRGFGSMGNLGYLNDLWKYDPVTNLWTWVSGGSTANQIGIYGTFGFPAPGNIPGTRYGASSFADGNGNLYLFGGYGYDSQGTVALLNDMWVYNISSNQWKWVKGANVCFQTAIYGTQGTSNINNVPGVRFTATSWKDASGNFWIFGGYGYNGSSTNGYLNDLWRYTPANNEWTWMKGSVLLDVNGTYGSQGTPATTNAPGGRSSSGSWTDNSGNLWMIGGYGYPSTGLACPLSDLWKYNVATNNWTWVKGNNTSVIQQGTYGTLGVFAGGNMPGARYDAITWLDANGDLWLFGGNGFDTGPTNDYLNDLWRYNITSNQWKWVKGSNTIAQPGTYGTIGVNSPLNMPGSRGGCSAWKDPSNNLWLFGGSGYNNANNVGKLGDLWKFDNCVNPTVVISASSPTLCLGKTVTLTATGANTYTWSGSQTGNTLAVTPPLGTSNYAVYGMDAYECRDTTVYMVTVKALPNLSTSSSHSVICAFESVTLSVSGAVSYTWTTSQNTATISVSPLATTNYTVYGSDANGCISLVNVPQVVSNCTGINTSGNILREEILIYPNPSNGVFSVQTDASEKKNFILYDALGNKVYEQILETNSTPIKVDLAKGIYYYRLQNAQQPSSKGKLTISE